MAVQFNMEQRTPGYRSRLAQTCCVYLAAGRLSAFDKLNSQPRSQLRTVFQSTEWISLFKDSWPSPHETEVDTMACDTSFCETKIHEFVS